MTGINIIPIEKKGKKEKWLSGEALQIAVKRREAKSKGSINITERQATEWEKVFTNDGTNKNLVSKIYKQHKQLTQLKKHTHTHIEKTGRRSK